MRAAIGFSHIVIETNNINNELKNFLKVGYKIKFDKKLKINLEKQKVLYKKPKNVRAVFLENDKNLSIELIKHNIQKKNIFNKILIGVNIKNQILKSSYYLNDKSFKNNLNVIIQTNNLFKEINFYRKTFNMQLLEINKKQTEFFYNRFKYISNIKGLFTKKNLFFKNKINFYFLETKYQNKKYYLNERGISCLSFLDINKNSYSILKKSCCGPLKLNIKESKIRRYYFLRDFDNFLLEVLN